MCAGRNLYWTDDALGQVSVARLDDASARRVLVRDAPERHYHPRAIALHPANGYATPPLASLVVFARTARIARNGNVSCAIQIRLHRFSLCAHRMYDIGPSQKTDILYFY